MRPWTFELNYLYIYINPKHGWVLNPEDDHLTHDSQLLPRDQQTNKETKTMRIVALRHFHPVNVFNNLPSKLTVRCANPTMKVDHFPSKTAVFSMVSMVFPHLSGSQGLSPRFFQPSIVTPRETRDQTRSCFSCLASSGFSTSKRCSIASVAMGMWTSNPLEKW